MSAGDGGDDTETECDTGRSGFMSYDAEVHAFAHGVYNGMARLGVKPPTELPENADVQAEPHYYKGGYVIGTLLQLAIALVLFTTALGAGIGVGDGTTGGPPHERFIDHLLSPGGWDWTWWL